MDTLKVVLEIVGGIASIFSIVGGLYTFWRLLKGTRAEDPNSVPMAPLATEWPDRWAPPHRGDYRPRNPRAAAPNPALVCLAVVGVLGGGFLLACVGCCGFGALLPSNPGKVAEKGNETRPRQAEPPSKLEQGEKDERFPKKPPKAERPPPNLVEKKAPKSEKDGKKEVPPTKESQVEHLPKPLVERVARAYSASDLWRKGRKADGERVAVTGVARVTVTSDRVLIHFEDDKVVRNRTLIFCDLPRDRAMAITGQTSGTTRRELTVEGDVSGETSPLELHDAAIVSAGAPLRD